MFQGSVRVERLREIFEELRGVDGEFPAQSVYALVQVALHGTITIAELSEKIDLTLGATSRNVSKLAIRHNGKEGLGLIKVDFDPTDYRRKVVELTPKGKALIDRLTKNL